MTKTNGRYQRNRAAGNEKEKEKGKKILLVSPGLKLPGVTRRFFVLSAQDLRAFTV